MSTERFDRRRVVVIRAPSSSGTKAGPHKALVGALVVAGVFFGTHFSSLAKSERAVAAQPEAGAACPPADRKLLESLLARRTELDARERLLDERQKRLGELEASFEARIAKATQELTTLEQRIELGEAASAAREKRMEAVVASVQVLPPAKATPMVEAADPMLAVGILKRLGPEAAGAILSKMKPTRASGLLELLAKTSRLDEIKSAMAVENKVEEKPE
ncbi:MAG: hypothetical protein HY791_25125 [Deltaproteobacteria bacterium]|nr:hypothetical protein [Deltaproteobacteria bacterium]